MTELPLIGLILKALAYTVFWCSLATVLTGLASFGCYLYDRLGGNHGSDCPH